MYYSVEGVFYEYEVAEGLFAEGKFTEAVEHYELLIAHYENADDIEKFPDMNRPVSMLSDGVEFEYPSVNECVSCANQRLKTIRRKLRNLK